MPDLDLAHSSTPFCILRSSIFCNRLLNDVVTSINEKGNISLVGNIKLIDLYENVSLEGFEGQIWI